MTMPDLKQKGPRAHHFVAGVSIAVALSFLFEYYTFNAPFVVIGSIIRIPVSGQHIIGTAMLVIGLFCLYRWNIWVRALALVCATGIWILYAGLSFWSSSFGPQAGAIGSYTAILSLAIVSTCILACANLKRDFPPPKG